MTQEFLFHFPISFSAKTAATPPLGAGFNGCVTLAWEGNAVPEDLPRRLREVINTIDHKSLGVDVKLPNEPTLTGLVQWLESEISRRGWREVKGLRLERSDGVSVSTGSLKPRD